MSVFGWLHDRSLRAKILIPVGVAVGGIGLVGVSGLVALGNTGDALQSMYAHTTLPLADLTELRDMQGDSRVEVRDAIVLVAGEQRDATFEQMHETDADADAAIDAYVKDHGSTLGAAREALIAQARSGLATWRQVRDDQLVPLVKAGDITAARALLATDGPLDKANSVFGEALDTLFEAEQADAAAVSAKTVTNDGRDRTLMILVSVLAIAAALVIGLLVARAILVPLGRVRQVLTGLAEGDLTGDPGLSSRDEVGQMASALVTANTALRRTVATIASSAQDLDEAAGQLTGSSGRIAAQVRDSAAQATVVASAADDASSSITGVSEGAQQLRAAVTEIAARAGQAATVANEAVTVAAETSATVEQLSQSSADIEQVLKVITSIAGQTNLLALNATIEAARAGESGKGFAVVATEVKELAQQTARATEDIAGRIAAIQSTSGEAISAIDRIGRVIAEINSHQTAIAAAVEQQTATAGEMQRGADQAAAASGQIAASIDTVAGAARATEGQVGDAQTTIAAMTRMSEELRTAVGRFRH